MALKVTKVPIWAGTIPDQPGGLATVLEQLGAARANLDCVIARRQPDKPGTGVAFLTPIKGRKATDVAKSAGFAQAGNIATLRIEGPSKPGVGGRICRAIGDAGISMRGISAAAMGNKFVAYLGFDSAADATKAAAALKKARI